MIGNEPNKESMNRMIKMAVLCSGVVAPLLFSISCAREKLDFLSKGNPMPAEAIEVVLNEYTEELMGLPGVVGTGRGLCDDKPCLKVLVIKETPEIDQKIPRILDGYPVVIEETGEIRALPKNKTDK